MSSKLPRKAPKKQTTKLRLQIFEKLSNINCILLKIKDYSANTEDPDETAHYEPSHLDLQCLQIQVGLFGALRVTSSERKFPF